jgi:hypothetical protein
MAAAGVAAVVDGPAEDTEPTGRDESDLSTPGVAPPQDAASRTTATRVRMMAIHPRPERFEIRVCSSTWSYHFFHYDAGGDNVTSAGDREHWSSAVTWN